MKKQPGELLLKICKTCRFWSTEKKGFCQHKQRGVGQFWYCEHWQAAPAAPGENADDKTSCRVCQTQAR